MKNLKLISSIIFLVLVALGLIFVLNKNSPKNQSGEIMEVKNDETKVLEDNNKMMKATIKTNKGDIVLELFGDKTPKTAGNFTKLASEGFYDGTKFHRIIAGFMIQGGDPQTKDDALSSLWGTGGPGYQFEDEIVPGLSNVIGTISMANSGPNTNGSQFFINVGDNTFLDGKHAVFGKVVEGLDIVMAISQAEKNQRDVPVEAIILEKVTVE